MARVERPYAYLKAHGSIAMPRLPGDRRRSTLRSKPVACEIAIGGGSGNEIAIRKAREIPDLPGNPGELVAVITLTERQREELTEAIMAASDDPIIETTYRRLARKQENE